MPANKTVFQVEKVTVPGSSASQTLLSLMAGSAFEAGMKKLTIQNVGNNVCYFNPDGTADSDSPELLPNGAVQHFDVGPNDARLIEVMAVSATRLNVQQEGE